MNGCWYKFCDYNTSFYKKLSLEPDYLLRNEAWTQRIGCFRRLCSQKVTGCA